MGINSAVYTTRVDVASAQDIKAASYTGRDIDRAIESGARDVDALLHRKLYPWTGTRSFDYPNQAGTPSWRIWFGEFGLITPTSILNNDTTTVAPASTFLGPQDGPPYEYVELNRGTSASFSSGSTTQRAVSVTGLWGYSNDEETAGTAAEAVDLTETGIDCSPLISVDVGSVIRIDSERMIVTDRSWLTTGQTATLTAAANAQTVTVADGTAFIAGEVLLIDAERVRVLDIAGNNLIVKRAVDGSTLAAHTSASVFASRTLTVLRGALGTTAATHLTSAAVYRWVPPGPAAELNLAYAIDHLLQRQAGYARTAGTGENQAQDSGRGVRMIETRAIAALGRRARTAVV